MEAPAGAERCIALADVVVEDVENIFEFIDEIGAGATATVYQAASCGAMQTEGGNGEQQSEVALKVYDLEALADDETFAAVKSEISALRSLPPHPHIVRLHEVVCDERGLTLVLDHLAGGELFALVVENGALVESHARAIFVQIVLALEHMHAHGLAHRDLKAENVVFAADDADGDEVKVVDFGSSAQFGASARVGMHGLVSTAHYVAPEVVSSAGYRRRGRYADIPGTGEPYSESCDLWSLGVLLFVLLSKRLPFAKPGDDEELAVLQRACLRPTLPLNPRPGGPRSRLGPRISSRACSLQTPPSGPR